MIHALEIFDSMPEVGKIIVASIESKIKEFKECIYKYGLSKAVCVPGGATRQESVLKALQYCDSEKVIIHEAVRPFITKEHIRFLMEEAIGHPVVVPCVSIPFTVANKKRSEYPERADLVNIQLPQVFDTLVLKAAHRVSTNLSFTDDSSLVFQATGHRPHFVEGLEENIKITTPLDISIAEAICETVRGVKD